VVEVVLAVVVAVGPEFVVAVFVVFPLSSLFLYIVQDNVLKDICKQYLLKHLLSLLSLLCLHLFYAYLLLFLFALGLKL
jgi:hypothetical protein